MFDGMQQAWAGERRGERWAATAGSIALHAVLIGWALIPKASAPTPPRKVIEVAMPPYRPTPVSPALPPPFTLDGAITLPDPSPIPTVDYAVAFDPDGHKPIVENLLHAMLATRGGTQPEPGPMIESILDDPPEVLTTPGVRYPPLLREAGIEGTVLLEFVVDTLGHAEPATIRIISSTNRAFEDPAREAILRSVYRPGQFRSERVRALAMERVAFTIR